jgi:hypothetical protein
VRRLADALGLQRVTAEVLVRRGVSDPTSRAFPRQRRPALDPFRLGDVEGPVS